jgi:hypothetical protein
MDRASGWYKKRIQKITLIVAFAIVLVSNADSIQLFERLWTNPAERQVLAGQAQAIGNKMPKDVNDLPVGGKQALSGLLGWKGPIAWNDPGYDPKEPNRFPNGLEWFNKLFGLAITAYAVSLGAPFWFDMLGKFMSVRGAGVPPVGRSADDRAITSIGGLTTSEQESKPNSEPPPDIQPESDNLAAEVNP